MAPNPRIKKACNAMKALGIQEAKVRPVIRELRKLYDDNWFFIEAENYKVLFETILDKDVVQRAQLAVLDEEDYISIKKRLRSSRQRGCQIKPIEEDRKRTQLALQDEEDEIEEDEIPLKRSSRSERERGCQIKPIEEDRKPEEEDDVMTEPPPLKKYLRRSGERRSARTVSNNTSPSVSSPMSTDPEELPPIMLLPAAPVVAEKDSVAGAPIIVKNEPTIDHKPIILDAENCSAPVLEMERSNTNVEERDEEANVTLNVTTAMVVPSSETVSDMIKAGDESGAADISMALVVVPECELSADGWRAFSNTKDITIGEENIEIPWVNEINDEVPSRFRYITHSVVFQDAAVKLFSVSSFSDNQCCFSCIGDCLGSSSMPCSCTTAYTVDGVLKEDFLEARISEVRDQRKQVLQFCQECPLEKAKKEETLEPCKGHIKRKAIKECWIKCGCAKRCGNRLVQRGIHRKLEVFFTPNGKGWGLRTLERLPQGSFVCEYVGEILTIPELYQRSLEGGLTSPVILDGNWGSEESLEDNKSLCLDGTRYGNISRFLNHRCLDANLMEIPVLVETPDQHHYHLAFFTTRDIEPMEELTWDYGIDFNDEDSLMKPFDCVCRSRFCRNIKQSKKAKYLINTA